MKAYKGFHKDLTCRGMQYEVGKTYTTDKAIACKSGFHACTVPLDCLGYYPPSWSVYHTVEQDGQLSYIQDQGDSKIASTKITIGEELDVEDLITAHKEYLNMTPRPDPAYVLSNPVFEPATMIGTEDNSICRVWDLEETALVRNYGYAQCSHLGTAIAGSCSVALARHSDGLAVARNSSIAKGEGNSTVVTNNDSFSVARGVRGTAVSGIRGKSIAGVGGQAVTGYNGRAEAGFGGVALGGSESSVEVGSQGLAIGGQDVTVGERGIGVVRGANIRARGEKGAILVFLKTNDLESKIEYSKTITIDGNRYKEDTYYTLINGEIVEAEAENF